MRSQPCGGAPLASAGAGSWTQPGLPGSLVWGSPDRGFRRDIQGLRGVAVIAVILHHAAGLLPGGFLGVDVFLVVSGFVIARSLVREHEETERLDLRDFYRRRVHRLVPALTATVGVVVLLAFVFAPDVAPTATATTGLAATLLAANVHLAREAGDAVLAAGSDPLSHTWAVSLAEQLHLVVPALVALLYAIGRRTRRPLRVVLVGLGAATLASLGVALALSLGPALPGLSLDLTRRLGFFALPARAWQFGVGCVLAVLLHRAGRPTTATRLSGIVGLFGLIVCFVVIGDELGHAGLLAILPTLLTALVLLDTDGPVSWGLSQRGFGRLGDVSYSWYLWHWPAIVFASALGVASTAGLAAVGLASYPVAAWSHRRIEQRYGQPGGRGSWARVLALSIVVGLVGWGVARSTVGA